MRNIDPCEHFSPGQKKVMFQNMVNGHKDLMCVKEQAEQHCMQSGEKLSYEQYCSLLLSAAAS
jgi:hypothetical protein